MAKPVDVYIAVGSNIEPEKLEEGGVTYKGIGWKNK